MPLAWQVIHEFDPWFNYRATEYLDEHGWHAFFHWFDYESWYPLGRPVGTTIYPGMQISAVAIWKALEAVGSFAPQWLTFGDGLQVITTALLAEDGFSFVYSAREVSAAGRTFAVKKVLVQDEETSAIAETEAKLLKEFSGQPGFVVCHGTMKR